MKAALPICVSLVFASTVIDASAACVPPEDANRTWCRSCGNLEQNVSRGFDLAWNKFLGDQRMQLELRVYGATTVYLVNPPHSSPGVLFYTVLIEDPQFAVADTQTYAQAVTLMNQYALGVGYEDGGARAEITWRRQTSQRIEELASTSISTGSAPYVMRLFDSRGNAVTGGTLEQPRQTPLQQLALAGPSDLHPDDRYRNEACEPEDARFPVDGPTTGSAGGPDERSGALDEDYLWELRWAWGVPRPHCVGDFSDPAGSGVICFFLP